MADSKLTALAEDTSPSADDILYSVNDPGGTPTSKKVTLSNLLKFVHGLTENTTPATTDEIALIDDPSSSPAPQRISLVNLLKVINGLTEDTTPDTANDMLLSYDASASTVKKVKMVNAAPAPVEYDYLSTLVNAEVSITGTDTATISKQHVCSGSSNYTVTLPAASGNTGKFLSFRFTNTGITTLDGNGAETIDGVATRVYYQGQSVTLYCDGSNWHTINTVSGGGNVCLPTLAVKHSKTQSTTYNAGQYNYYYTYQSTPNDGDTIEFWVFLKKGDYTFFSRGVTQNLMGKRDYTMDGVSIATGEDWYSASTTYSVSKSFTFSVTWTGFHKFVMTINGKNASSTNYYYGHTEFDIYPA